MTVGSQVKSCFSSVKSIEASLGLLRLQSTENESEKAFKQAEEIIKEIKNDLDQQVIFLSQQEPQYKQ